MLPQASGPRIFREWQKCIQPPSRNLNGTGARPGQMGQEEPACSLMPSSPPGVPNAPACLPRLLLDTAARFLPFSPGRRRAEIPRGARSRHHRAGESCPSLLRGPLNIPARQPKTRIRKTTPHEALLSQPAERSGGSLVVANRVAGRRGKAPAQGTRQRAGDGAHVSFGSLGWRPANECVALTRVGLLCSCRGEGGRRSG